MEPQVEAFLADLETQKTYSASTRMAYASDLRHFLKYLQGTLNHPPTLQDLKIKFVADFLTSEQETGLGRNTLLRRRATLRVFATYLLRKRLIEDNPFYKDGGRTDDIIATGAPKNEKNHLTEKQIDRLWEALRSHRRPHARRDLAMLALTLDTGMLVSHLVDLNLDDLDLQKGRLRLRVDQGTPLWIPLEAAIEPLISYLSEGRPELSPSSNERALFISQMGKRLTRQSLWQIFRHWGQTAELPIPLSPRIIRHTAALRMARSGKSISEIQILLGHSNPLSTRALLRRLEARGQTPALLGEKTR